MNKFKDILFGKYTDSWNHNIPVYLSVECGNLSLKIVQIVISLVRQSTRTTLSFNKATLLNVFICSFLKTDISFKVTQ